MVLSTFLMTKAPCRSPTVAAFSTTTTMVNFNYVLRFSYCTRDFCKPIVRFISGRLWDAFAPIPLPPATPPPPPLELCLPHLKAVSLSEIFQTFFFSNTIDQRICMGKNIPL